jgi:hypothetical protein
MSAKAKLAPKQEIQLAETMGLEKLQEIFSDLIGAVDEMLENQNGKPQAEDMAALSEKAKVALSAPERIDQLIALLNAHEFQEALLRRAVQQAEKRARSHAKFCASIKGSVELYMLEAGILRIEGFAHRFAIYKQPDQLEVTNESLVPDEYWEKIPVIERKLNKDKLLADLQAKKEIPGAELYTERRRLDVK